MARTLKAKAKAWTLNAKVLNPRGQDQGHEFVSSRVLEAKACPRGLHHWFFDGSLDFINEDVICANVQLEYC